MKKILVIICGVFVLINTASALESLSANLSLPSDIASQCTSEVGAGTLPIIWSGVKDKRNVKAVGVLKKKYEEADVVAVEPVEKLLEKGLKAMFEKCGYPVAAGSNTNAIKISADLNEFFAGSKKGLIMGETQAKGGLTIYVMRGGRSVDLQYTAAIEDKGFKKNIKKMERTLSDLLGTLINKVASTTQFAEAMKDLSK